MPGPITMLPRFPHLDRALASRPGYWLAWAAAAGYNTARDVFDAPLHYLLVFNGAHFLVWALIGLWAVPFARRHPLSRHWRPWVLHLVVGSLLTMTDVFLGHFLTTRILRVGLHADLWTLFVEANKACFHLGLLTYAGMVAVVQGMDAQRQARERAVRGAQLEAELAQAQLRALRQQLQPHFLFNTLHSVASLMHYDVATADRMLNRLSDLLRLSLQQFGTQTVTLRQEIAFLQAYLDIEMLRFEQRLRVDWSIPDPLGETDVPPFLLQPLVENAIKHGIAPRAAGGQLRIRAYAEADALCLEVEDDGTGAPATPGFGIGLENTRARLHTLYGASHVLELVRAAGGTIARIRLPLAPALQPA